MTIILRKQAKIAGLVRYFTGVPCKHGHIFERLTSDGGCLKCKRLKRSISWYTHGYARAIDKRNYQRRRDKILAERKILYRTNIDKYKLRSRLQYQKHRDSRIQSSRNWREHNKQKLKYYYAVYAKRRPEVYRNSARRRRAFLYQAVGTFTNEQWIHKCGQYLNLCAWCKQSKILHADHIVPLSLGGSNLIDNIQPLCKSCNSKKATKIMAFPTADGTTAIYRLP